MEHVWPNSEKDRILNSKVHSQFGETKIFIVVELVTQIIYEINNNTQILDTLRCAGGQAPRSLYI